MNVRVLTKKEYPPLDLLSFRSLDFDQKQRFASELKQRLDQFGFMVFKNHGVSEQALGAGYEACQQFFSLDRATKLKYKAHQAGMNGYFPYLFETAVTSKEPDLKEFWHVLREAIDENGQPLYPENRWPEEATSFSGSALRLFEMVDECSTKIMEVLSIILKVPEDFFKPICKNGCSTLRMIHYPPIRNDIKAGQIRAGTHTGIQMIGIQPRTTHPGLEFFTHEGEWVRLGEEFDDCISVNVGDMMQAISNAHLLATPHRVVNPNANEKNESRYAIVYFYHANPQVYIEPLSHLPTRSGYESFPKMLAWDWLKQRIKEISRNSLQAAD